MENILAENLILLVDDDPGIIMLVKESLEKEGFRTVSTMDGREAINHVEHYNPDMVILDLWLPDMDGFEICRRIRHRSDSIPILMLTGRRRVDDKLQGLSCGADDYLIKPFSPKELVARVKALLRRRSGATNKPVDPVHDPLKKLRG